MNYFAECEEGACDDCNFHLLDLDMWSSQVHRHQANDNTKNKYSLKFMTFKAKFELWINATTEIHDDESKLKGNEVVSKEHKYNNNKP